MADDEVNILLVDDRRENLVALEAVLEPLCYNLVSVQSGDEALRQLLQHKFSLILLDVQMPEMDGFELAQLIKQNDRTRDIPIIFITAISKEPRYALRGYSVGAVAYISKPFDPGILRRKVEAFIEPPREKDVVG